MRILGRGKTAQAILEQYPDSKLYDDLNIEEFNKDSEELTVVSPGIPPYNQLVKNTKKHWSLKTTSLHKKLLKFY